MASKIIWHLDASSLEYRKFASDLFFAFSARVCFFFLADMTKMFQIRSKAYKCCADLIAP